MNNSWKNSNLHHYYNRTNFEKKKRSHIGGKLSDISTGNKFCTAANVSLAVWNNIGHRICNITNYEKHIALQRTSTA